jgi:hypothetical protein
MACVKGSLDGFSKGFYANESESISPDCLGQQTYTHVSEFFKLMGSGDIMQVFKSFGKIYQVSFDIQKSCRFNQISFDVVGFCLNSTNDCRINTIISHLQTNLFKLTDAANKFVENVFDQYSNFAKTDLTDLATAATNFSELGKKMGSVVRVVLGFTNTQSTGRKSSPPAPVVPSTFV